MANYDQSGNPIGNQGGQQGGGRMAGQPGGAQGSQGQQSQYSPQGQGRQYGGSAQQGGAGMQRQSGREMQRGNRDAMSGFGGGLFPELYSGLGSSPFQLISRLSEEMDRMFESFGMGPSVGRGVQRGGRGEGGPGLRELWAPRIEVCERDGKLLIQADLPGVRKEDVNVQIEDDAVVIQGQRQQENTRNEQGFYHSERSYGSFYRMIPLPEGVDADQANATYRDGVLQIELPMPQQRQRGRRLEIREGSAEQGRLGAASGSTVQASGAQHGQSQSTMSGQQGGAQSSPGGQQKSEGSSERR